MQFLFHERLAGPRIPYGIMASIHTDNHKYKSQVISHTRDITQPFDDLNHCICNFVQMFFFFFLFSYTFLSNRQGL